MTAVLKDKEKVLSYGIKDIFKGVTIARKTEINTEITKNLVIENNKDIYNDLEDGMSL